MVAGCATQELIGHCSPVDSQGAQFGRQWSIIRVVLDETAAWATIPAASRRSAPVATNPTIGSMATESAIKKAMVVRARRI